jgi:uracil-DNA glycosylase
MVVTVHPAYLLRLTDEGRKREEWANFLDDLRLAKDAS